ncbi:MAG: hypothetical protein Kow001_11690 [Acidobacteriota bacterium]
MEELFSALFKFRPFYFAEGDFHFRTPISFGLYFAAWLSALAFLAWLYRTRLRSNLRQGLCLLGLKGLWVLVILLLLMQPTLTLSTLVPQENLVAVLLDNSRSLGILERGVPRGAPAAALAAPGSAFRSALERNFHVRWHHFDQNPRTPADPATLDWSGEQTNLSAALQAVLADSRSLPYAGVVLVTDGADNSFRDVASVVREFAARGIPIHTVGVGPEAVTHDVEIVSVSLPDRVLPDSVAVARIQIRHPGFRGNRAQLLVRDGSTLVSSSEVTFSRISDQTTAEVKLFPEFTGIKAWEFSVAPLHGEQLVENNALRTVFEVRDSRPRVLMVEGRPRWEYKFIRQAMSGDRYVRLESLLRSAINKFYRQGIEQETTLAAGFPTRREDLFEYQGLILGDVESAFFTYAQMEMIRDFVSRRGGGLLMVGGGSTLGSGGYQNTPVEEALPVWLGSREGRPAPDMSYLRVESQVQLTDFGANHPALRLAREDEQSSRLWTELPPLSDRNRVSGIKPGAVVLVEARDQAGSEGEATREPSPLLVSHRFGRGLGIVLLSGSSWRWQMLKEHTDQSHELFWRQLTRWLVSSARDPVTVEVERGVYSRNQPVRARVEVNDAAYQRLNDARLKAHIVRPDGSQEPLSLTWDSHEEGVFTGQWFPTDDGIHRIEVEAHSSDPEPTALGTASDAFLVATGQAEYFDAVRKVEFLKGIARDTGGRYYGIEEADRLPEEIRYVQSESSVTEVLDLWDMPFNFLLLAGLLVGEWLLRRHWGLP